MTDSTNTENPANVKERAPEAPVVADVKKVFEEKAAEVQGDKTVYDAHREEFAMIVNQLPENQRGSINVRIADLWNRAGGAVHEGYARLRNFMYNLTNPAHWVNKDVPNDFFYQREKARVQGRVEVKTLETRQQSLEWEAFKQVIPLGGGKALDIVDRIVGPKLP